MAPENEDVPTGAHPSAHLRTAPERHPVEPGEPLSARYPLLAPPCEQTVTYGPGLPDESALRLLGHVEGKRVLELGNGHAAVALAAQGAHVIAVDPSHRRLDRVRSRCEEAEVRVEFHQSDLAELPFVRADTVDAVVSVFALAGVADLDRVFRQAHRVLRTGGPIVLSLPHPAYAMVGKGDPQRIVRAWFDRTPVQWQAGPEVGEENVRSMAEVFTSLTRANFRVDTVLEPEPAVQDPMWDEAMSWVPSTLLVRARKEGI